MKQAVEHLRDGWHGTFAKHDNTDYRFRRPVDCRKLMRHSIDEANKKFIPRCEGISGTIGSLVVDETYVGETIDFPIDALVLDLTKDYDDADETTASGAIVAGWV